VCKSRVQHLTRREVEVLLLIASDLANTEIARSLVIDVRTIEAHVTNMLRKAGSRTRVGLLVRCYAAGILIPADHGCQWSGVLCLGPDSLIN
jgi:DNA-binding CsgD family transcriptional regulator